MDKKILQNFSGVKTVSAIKTFFSELNIPLVGGEEKPFEFKKLEPFSTYYKEDNDTYKLIQDIYFGGSVDDSAFSDSSSTSFENITANKEKYDGLLVSVVTLNESQTPTRGMLAEITRFLNRSSYYLPVTVLFEYKENGQKKLSLSNSARQEFKQEWREGEKIGKVSILYGIDAENPIPGILKF